MIELRAVEESDLPILFEHQLDPEATRMAAFPSRDRDAFFAHWRKILANPDCIARAIVSDGAVAGNICAWTNDGRRLVGYWIDRASWGRGIATAALAAFVREVKQRPLHAFVSKTNVGSVRVLEKCGFVAIGSHMDGEIEELLMELR